MKKTFGICEVMCFGLILLLLTVQITSKITAVLTEKKVEERLERETEIEERMGRQLTLKFKDGSFGTWIKVGKTSAMYLEYKPKGLYRIKLYWNQNWSQKHNRYMKQRIYLHTPKGWKLLTKR